ncbi:MAG: flagellar biosynthetic protein FliO [Dehalococcoidia bacterium]|nr:flagellar biosynthetic protein FliO [Dehalococcoidia bacterium]
MNDARTRKKLLWAAALGGVLLCSLIFISIAAPSAPATVESPRITATADGTFTQAAGSASGVKDSADNDPAGFGLGGGQMFSLAWRLVLVGVIIAASIAGLRWWGRRAAGPRSTTGFLRVVDTLAISNGRAIHLVALGERVIAVGATAQQLTFLNELTEEEASTVSLQAAKPDEQPLGQFAAQLFEQMKRTTGRGQPGRVETVIGQEH